MKKLFLLGLALAVGGGLRAQLFIDQTYSIDQMIHGFFDPSGVVISNVSYTGTNASLAFFEGSQSNIGLNAGLLITSGDAAKAPGPNDSESAGAAMNVPGNPWLNDLIPGYTTYDASVIEMDIVPAGDTLNFSYVFASEEYKEFVGTSFNDLFAFLVEGPGLPQGDTIWVPADTIVSPSQDSACLICVDSIYFNPIWQCDSLPNGLDTCWIVGIDTITIPWCYYDPACPGDTIIYPGYFYNSSGGVNMAIVPNSNLPVTINNLNQNQFSQYFVDNAGGTTVQYDGFTTPLSAQLVVQAGQTYHVRIAVADAGDAVFDSGVFLGVESLGNDSLLPTVPLFLATPVSPGSTTIAFENKSLWGTKWHWDFGDGTTSNERNPTHQFFNFGPQGSYDVKLTVDNWCSSNSFSKLIQTGTSATTEPQTADVFQALPNPTSGQFTLDLKNLSSAPVKLFSIDGRLLLSSELADGSQIDLNQFGKGLFLLQVVNDGRVFTEKVLNR